MTLDVMPTLIELAGAKLPTGHKLDGVSFASLLLEGRRLAPRQRFWGHVSGSGKTSYAMRDGNWKLVVEARGKPHLFDLRRDLKEAKNLASDEPRRTKSMLSALNAWKQDVKKSRPKD